jgi:flagellin
MSDDLRDFVAQIDQIGDDSEFNEKNLIEAGATGTTALADLNGGTLAIPAVDLSSVTLGYGVIAAGTITSTQAATYDTLNDTAFNTVQVSLGIFGAAARSVELKQTFNQKVADTFDEGIGAIVDSDMASAAAKLTALQVQEQLALQTLNIVSRTSTALEQLF